MEEPMVHVTIECPEEVLRALETTPQAFSREAVMLLGAKLYEMGRLSTGQAARLAGIPRVEFILRLADYGVAYFSTDPSELERDAEAARSHG